MKFQSRLNVAGHPDVKLRLRLSPVAVDLAAAGSAEMTSGPIELTFGEIPVVVRIPFHRRRVVAALVGPVRMRVNPLTIAARCADVRVTGAVGSEEGGIDADLVGACGAEIGVFGDWHRQFDDEAESEAGP
jgi:hypothetical protein